LRLELPAVYSEVPILGGTRFRLASGFLASLSANYPQGDDICLMQPTR